MKRTFIVAGSLALLVAFVAPAAAQSAAPGRPVSDITYLTFSQPVQVPGATLVAGTYTFRRLAPRVVLVESRDGSTVYTTFMTLPRWRTNATDKDEVVFGEAACCAPAPVTVWFPAFRLLGDEFIYPKAAPVTHMALK